MSNCARVCASVHNSIFSPLYLPYEWSYVNDTDCNYPLPGSNNTDGIENEKVTGSKVKVSQQWPWTACELVSS